MTFLLSRGDLKATHGAFGAQATKLAVSSFYAYKVAAGAKEPRSCTAIDSMVADVGSMNAALNLLTPTIVQKASSEIKCGRSVSLDLPLDYFPDRLGDRRAFERNVIDYHAKYGMYVYDDELHFNTQSSSQWDGMTHCATQQDGYYYNGLKHEDVLKKKDGRNGTHSMSGSPQQV